MDSKQNWGSSYKEIMRFEEEDNLPKFNLTEEMEDEDGPRHKKANHEKNKQSARN